MSFIQKRPATKQMIKRRHIALLLSAVLTASFSMAKTIEFDGSKDNIYEGPGGGSTSNNVIKLTNINNTHKFSVYGGIAGETNIDVNNNEVFVSGGNISLEEIVGGFNFRGDVNNNLLGSVEHS